jgi:hypothetical protein
MLDKETAQIVELRIDSTGKVWVNVDEVCAVRIGKVATLQLSMDSNQYISRTKDGVFITRRHEVSGEVCWCGKKHIPAHSFIQAKPSGGPIPFKP